MLNNGSAAASRRKRRSQDVKRSSQGSHEEKAEEIRCPTPPQLYTDAAAYWAGVQPTVDGMLGGFECVSEYDIVSSRQFLTNCRTTFDYPAQLARAVDCGAGIGRITKGLLLPLFDRVDMVELTQTFLDQATSFIGPDFARVGQRYCMGLQDFTPDPHSYDLIWIQWVIGHLTPHALTAFLVRCSAGLTPSGLIVVKENVTKCDEAEFDATDSSYTRPRDEYVSCFEQANLQVIKEEKQKGFPTELYPVLMFALRPRMASSPDVVEGCNGVTAAQ